MRMLWNKKTVLTGLVLAFFMLLTRGSHVLTQFALADASLAVFLMGGLLLKRWLGFVAFFALACLIDMGATSINPAFGFCITDGYWGLIPSYAVMWGGGSWLAKHSHAFKPLPYAMVTTSTTLIAFVISTQTYYLFSGRYAGQSMMQTIQLGWEYLPSWMGYSMLYFAVIWLVAYGLRQLNIIKPALRT